MPKDLSKDLCPSRDYGPCIIENGRCVLCLTDKKPAKIPTKTPEVKA
jgi:hypothetical protein